MKGGGGTENKIVHSIFVVFNFSFLEIVELQIKNMYAVCVCVRLCVCVYVCVCMYRYVCIPSPPPPTPQSIKRRPLSFSKDGNNILHSSDAIFKGADNKNYRG